MSVAELEVGRIGRPHGVRGMLKVELYWSASDTLNRSEQLLLELTSGERRAFAIESRARSGRGWLVKFAGVDDREHAQMLSGARLWVPRHELAPLAEGEAYLVDLVGAQVFAPDGPVGEVVRVEVNPSVDSLVIRAPDGRLLEQALLPAFIARLAPSEGRVELSTRDGLIE